MLVTWITLELPELSEDPIDWFPTGTRAISIVEPRYTRKFKVIQQKNLSWNLSTNVEMSRELINWLKASINSMIGGNQIR